MISTQYTGIRDKKCAYLDVDIVLVHHFGGDLILEALMSEYVTPCSMRNVILIVFCVASCILYVQWQAEYPTCTRRTELWKHHCFSGEGDVRIGRWAYSPPSLCQMPPDPIRTSPPTNANIYSAKVDYRVKRTYWIFCVLQQIRAFGLGQTIEVPCAGAPCAHHCSCISTLRINW